MRVTAEHLDQVLHPQFAASDRTVHRHGPRAPRRAPPSGTRLLHRRRRRRRRRPRREGHPRAQRDLARGRARHDGGRGHPHRRAAASSATPPSSPAAGASPAVVGAEAVADRRRPRSPSAASTVNEGDVISLDGTTGEVDARRGRAVARPSRRRSSTRSSAWADEIRKGKLGVRANADNGPDAANARQFGAEGIGLCRTEHMFLGEDRLPVVRRMILADTPEEEAAALEELREVAEGRLRSRSSRRWTACRSPCACSTRRCTSSCPDVEELADQAGHRRASPTRSRSCSTPPQAWQEFNPMLGTRGVRLGVVKPGPLRHAGAGAHGGGRRARAAKGGKPDRRDHDPAHRHPRGAARWPAPGSRTRSPRPTQGRRKKRRSTSPSAR